MLRPKKNGRKDATVYVEPYWFDESQSLADLHGLESVERAELASPVGSLTIPQLEVLLRDRIDPHYLAPIAIARLRGGELGLAERTLIRSLVDLVDFWDTHPYLRAQLAQILQAHLARNPSDDLHAPAAGFLQIG